MKKIEISQARCNFNLLGTLRQRLVWVLGGGGGELQSKCRVRFQIRLAVSGCLWAVLLLLRWMDKYESLHPAPAATTAVSVLATNPAPAQSRNSGRRSIESGCSCQSNQAFLEQLRSEGVCRRGRRVLRLCIFWGRRRCAICQQLVKRKSAVFRIQCGHVFHHRCLTAWRKHNPNCPLCRRRLA